jgi:hypothetical protein
MRAAANACVVDDAEDEDRRRDLSGARRVHLPEAVEGVEQGQRGHHVEGVGLRVLVAGQEVAEVEEHDRGQRHPFQGTPVGIVRVFRNHSSAITTGWRSPATPTMAAKGASHGRWLMK